MSNNLENERSVTTGKMYPIDLAPQKITIVKSMTNSEVKMAHLISGQPKTTSSAGSMGLMRTTAQIISPGVPSQGTQIVSQGSQLIGQNSQIISQPQLIPSGQILSPGTQIISQGTQLSAQASNNNNTLSNSVQSSNVSTGNGTQLLNVGSLVGGAANLVVSSSVRTLPPSVRVLPPIPQHNTRPVLSNMNVNNSAGVLVNKGMTSHVPRGLAAGASLAVRPVTNPQPAASQGGAWSNGSRGGRGRALVYGCRARSPAPRAATPAPPTAAPPASSPLAPHAPLVSLPTTSVLTSSGVISSTVRGAPPRTPTPVPPAPPATAPRPLPLLQRNYQPAKVVGVASVGVRGVGNSAPPQLYYEVPRPSPHHQQQQQSQQQQQLQTTLQQQLPHQVPRPLTPYAHVQPAQVSVVNTQSLSETRQTPASVQNSTVLPRPSILRKRDTDGSPTKNLSHSTTNNVTTIVSTGNIGNMSSIGNMNNVNNMSNVTLGQVYPEGTGWEDVPTGTGSGSTTISAGSSPAPDLDPDPAPEQDLSPRKKPRKQILSNEVRQCDFPAEDTPPSPPPAVSVTPLPKRPMLSSSYVCEWRGTERHFARPADVRRREPRARDIVAIASQRHVLTSAEGWKVHHLTAQMDDLVSLEADVGEQLMGVLRALETASPRANLHLQSLQHTLLELIKGNIQRSKIVCEGIQEAREDILRVFKHRNFVSDILTRQADKRCFRKHRSQS